MGRRIGPCGRTLYHHTALLDLPGLHLIVEHLRLLHERAYTHRGVARAWVRVRVRVRVIRVRVGFRVVRARVGVGLGLGLA